MMAGVGGIHRLADFGYRTVGVELELEWCTPGTIQGDATQLPFVDSTFDACIVSPCFGNRMCLVGGTLVLTNEGFIPIESVRVGHKVLTHMGRWRKVLWSGSTGVKPVVETRGPIANRLVSTYDHQFLAAERSSSYWERLSLGAPQWYQAQELGGRYWLSPTKVARLPVPALPIKVLDEEMFWWAVGLWLADGWGYRTELPNGCWRRAGVWWCANEDQADLVEKHLREAFGERVKKVKDANPKMVRFVVYSQDLLVWMYRWFGHLAHGKKLAAWSLGLPRSSRQAVLDGYLQGDGCLVIRDGSVANHAVSVNRPLLRGIQMLVHTLGGAATIALTKHEGQEKVAGRDCLVRESWTLKTHSAPTRRVRSYGEFLAAQVTSVVPLGDEVVYDLEVEEDHSFIAEGVIVHNSDHHNAQDGSYRRTYRYMLGRELHPRNTGQLQWGPAYKVMHAVAWYEVWRVLRPGGVFVLDHKDHIRDHRRQHVTSWHYEVITGLGFELAEIIRPEVKGFKYGENRDNPGKQPFRLPEKVLVFVKPQVSD